MECQNCKFDNPKHEKYCLNCGAQLRVANDGEKQKFSNWIWILIPFLGIVLFLGAFLLLRDGGKPEISISTALTGLPTSNIGEKEITKSPAQTMIETPAVQEFSIATPTEVDNEPKGKIVFTCQVDRTMNHDQICTINADGSDWKQLTDNLKYEHYYASFSADGSEIAFSSSLPDRKGFNIFLMNSDGSNLRQVTSRLGDFYAPALSTDGQYLVATRHVGEKNYITLLTRDGKYIEDLNLYHDCKDPVWSPDGSEILFAADPSKSEIQFYVMNKDGSDVRKLTNIEGIRGRCDWSVDGTMASYTGVYEQQNREIFLFGKNKSPQIITDGGDNLAPSFSPDGKWITFMSYRDNFWDPDGCEIYIMRLEDGFTKRLTNNDYCDYQPRWGP